MVHNEGRWNHQTSWVKCIRYPWQPCEWQPPGMVILTYYAKRDGWAADHFRYIYIYRTAQKQETQCRMTWHLKLGSKHTTSLHTTISHPAHPTPRKTQENCCHHCFLFNLAYITFSHLKKASTEKESKKKFKNGTVLSWWKIPHCEHWIKILACAFLGFFTVMFFFFFFQYLTYLVCFPYRKEMSG